MGVVDLWRFKDTQTSVQKAFSEGAQVLAEKQPRPVQILQFLFISLKCFVLSVDSDLWEKQLPAYEQTFKNLIDPTVWISSWKTSQYASGAQAQNKLQKQAGSAPAQQTNIHPFIQHSDDHTGCFLTLSLWSSDYVCVCALLSLYPTKEQWWKLCWVNMKPFNGFIPLTLSHDPIWEKCHCHCMSVLTACR